MFSMQIGVPEAKAILQQCWEGADCKPLLSFTCMSILVWTVQCQCPWIFAVLRRKFITAKCCNNT